jgi:hypothetical protein
MRSSRNIHTWPTGPITFTTFQVVNEITWKVVDEVSPVDSFQGDFPVFREKRHFPEGGPKS